MTRTSVPSLTWKDYAAARAGAGWCWNPARETAEQGRVRSHLATARALYALRHDPDAYVDFVPSAFPWDGDEPYDDPLWDAALYIGDEIVASCCCIAAESPDDPYCQCIGAELYMELEARREEMTERSVN